jgi:hypothetical protein
MDNPRQLLDVSYGGSRQLNGKVGHLASYRDRR